MDSNIFEFLKFPFSEGKNNRKYAFPIHALTFSNHRNVGESVCCNENNNDSEHVSSIKDSLNLHIIDRQGLFP